VEMQFKTCGKTEWTTSDSPYKGVIVVYDTGVIEYKPKTTDFAAWRKTLEGDELRILYWTLNNIRIENVLRDPKWMSDHIEELNSFWAMVQECRKDPSKIESYIPTTAPPDAPSPALEAAGGNQAPACGSSAAHTTTLRLFLDDAEPSDPETRGRQTSRGTQTEEHLLQ